MYNFSPLFRNSILLCNRQSIRWRSRKPFWHGLAKSKITKVTERKRLPENEEVEYNRLLKEYNILEASIYQFMKDIGGETETELRSSEDALQKEIELSLMLNEQWNAEIAAERKKRMQMFKDSKMKFIETYVDEYENKRRERQLRVDEIVLQEIENSKSFVTLENLDEKIEESLRKITDYNFALELDGSKFNGSEVYAKLKRPYLAEADEKDG